MFEPCFDDGMFFSYIFFFLVMTFSHLLNMLGINSPRTSWNTHKELPPSRLLGNYIADFCNNVSSACTGYKHTQISVLAAMFGQLVAHDCSGRATAVVEGASLL